MGSVIENEKTKEKCQIFTPDDIVKSMLNHLGYSDHLYGKTILESSCGTGQFLKEIVIRYIKELEASIAVDKRSGKDCSKKEAALQLVKKDFFEYFDMWEKESKGPA